MKNLPVRPALAALLFALLSGCGGTQAYTPPQTDGDQAGEAEPEQGINCLEQWQVCDDEDDCAPCGEGAWQCCNGLCARDCGVADGDRSDNDVIDFDDFSDSDNTGDGDEAACSAEGAICQEAVDCRLACPGDTRTYYCTDSRCSLVAPDGDEDTGDVADLPDAGDEDAQNGDEPQTDAEPEDEEDPCDTGLPNRAPQVTPGADQVVHVGETLSFPIEAWDPDPCDRLSYTCTQCPTGSRLDAGQTPPLFILSPTLAQVGEHPVVITVSDSGDPVLTAQLGLTVKVVNDNQPPQVASVEDRQLLLGDTLVLYIPFVDPEGDPVSLAVQQIPSWITLEVQDNNRVECTLNAATLSGGGLQAVSFILSDNRGNPTTVSFNANVLPRDYGDTCAKAVKLLPGDIYFGNTRDRSAALIGTVPCIEYQQDGPDMMFAVPNSAPVNLAATVWPLGAAFDPGLYVMNAGCTSCITGDDLRGDNTEELLVFNARDFADEQFILVVDSDTSSKKGDFKLQVLATETVVAQTDICAPCQNRFDCGYEGNCVQFFKGSTVVETACGRNCIDDSYCPRGYECPKVRFVDMPFDVRQCVPRNYNDMYEVATCAAVRDIWSACPNYDDERDEAACGADDVVVLDDADCEEFEINGHNEGRCTLTCYQDSDCPPAFQCDREWWQFSGNCVP